ncbi:unnamed protein product [Amoebophrya sp. A25]|nr:unnamed protein product [Amoebophrya sp. A25]|eukprot:GSA25T00020540001.1
MSLVALGRQGTQESDMMKATGGGSSESESASSGAFSSASRRHRDEHANLAALAAADEWKESDLSSFLGWTDAETTEHEIDDEDVLDFANDTMLGAMALGLTGQTRRHSPEEAKRLQEAGAAYRAKKLAEAAAARQAALDAEDAVEDAWEQAAADVMDNFDKTVEEQEALVKKKTGTMKKKGKKKPRSVGERESSGFALIEEAGDGDDAKKKKKKKGGVLGSYSGSSSSSSLYTTGASSYTSSSGSSYTTSSSDSDIVMIDLEGTAAKDDADAELSDEMEEEFGSDDAENLDGEMIRGGAGPGGVKNDGSGTGRVGGPAAGGKDVASPPGSQAVSSVIMSKRAALRKAAGLNEGQKMSTLLSELAVQSDGELSTYDAAESLARAYTSIAAAGEGPKVVADIFASSGAKAGDDATASKAAGGTTSTAEDGAKKEPETPAQKEKAQLLRKQQEQQQLLALGLIDEPPRHPLLSFHAAAAIRDVFLPDSAVNWLRSGSTNPEAPVPGDKDIQGIRKLTGGFLPMYPNEEEKERERARPPLDVGVFGVRHAKLLTNSRLAVPHPQSGGMPLGFLGFRVQDIPNPGDKPENYPMSMPAAAGTSTSTHQSKTTEVVKSGRIVPAPASDVQVGSLDHAQHVLLTGNAEAQPSIKGTRKGKDVDKMLKGSGVSDFAAYERYKEIEAIYAEMEGLEIDDLDAIMLERTRHDQYDRDYVEEAKLQQLRLLFLFRNQLATTLKDHEEKVSKHAIKLMQFEGPLSKAMRRKFEAQEATKRAAARKEAEKERKRKLKARNVKIALKGDANVGKGTMTARQLRGRELNTDHIRNWLVQEKSDNDDDSSSDEEEKMSGEAMAAAKKALEDMKGADEDAAFGTHPALATSAAFHKKRVSQLRVDHVHRSILQQLEDSESEVDGVLQEAGDENLYPAHGIRLREVYPTVREFRRREAMLKTKELEKQRKTLLTDQSVGGALLAMTKEELEEAKREQEAASKKKEEKPPPPDDDEDDDFAADGLTDAINAIVKKITDAADRVQEKLEPMVDSVVADVADNVNLDNDEAVPEEVMEIFSGNQRASDYASARKSNKMHDLLKQRYQILKSKHGLLDVKGLKAKGFLGGQKVNPNDEDAFLKEIEDDENAHKKLVSPEHHSEMVEADAQKHRDREAKFLRHENHTDLAHPSMTDRKRNHHLVFPPPHVKIPDPDVYQSMAVDHHGLTKRAADFGYHARQGHVLENLYQIKDPEEEAFFHSRKLLHERRRNWNGERRNMNSNIPGGVASRGASKDSAAGDEDSTGAEGAAASFFQKPASPKKEKDVEKNEAEGDEGEDKSGAASSLSPGGGTTTTKKKGKTKTKDIASKDHQDKYLMLDFNIPEKFEDTAKRRTAQQDRKNSTGSRTSATGLTAGLLTGKKSPARRLEEKQHQQQQEQLKNQLEEQALADRPAKKASHKFGWSHEYDKHLAEEPQERSDFFLFRDGVKSREDAMAKQRTLLDAKLKNMAKASRAKAKEEHEAFKRAARDYRPRIVEATIEMMRTGGAPEGAEDDSALDESSSAEENDDKDKKDADDAADDTASKTSKKELKVSAKRVRLHPYTRACAERLRRFGKGEEVWDADDGY